MSEQQLRDLLRDTAEPVEAPALAESCWRLAGVRRRRRHAAVGTVAAALAVVLVGGGLLTTGRDHGHPAPGTRASAQPSATYHLPVAPTKLPRTIDTDPSHAEKLSTHPLHGPALGLFAAYPKSWPARIPDSISVLVLGQDGRMRLIDTASIRSSGDGYDPAPVLPGSLSPSGTKAAFPQMNGNLLVVDLTGTGHRSYFLGHETVDSMWWIGDGTVAASTATATHFVDLRSKGIHTVMVPDALAPRRPSARSDLVSFADVTGLRQTEIRRYGDDGVLLDRRRSTVRPYSHWYGPGMTDATRAARAAIGTKVHPLGDGNSVVVMPLDGDSRDAVTVDLPGGNGRHQKAPLVILGWPQPDRLIVLDHARGTDQVLSVDLGTEKVSVTANLTQDSQVALRPGVY